MIQKPGVKTGGGAMHFYGTLPGFAALAEIKRTTLFGLYAYRLLGCCEHLRDAETGLIFSAITAIFLMVRGNEMR